MTDTKLLEFQVFPSASGGHPDYHATARGTVIGADATARWDAVEAAAYAAGWRLLGWRTYAVGDAADPYLYRVTADLYRTADDVRAGSLQLTARL